MEPSCHSGYVALDSLYTYCSQLYIGLECWTFDLIKHCPNSMTGFIAPSVLLSELLFCDTVCVAARGSAILRIGFQSSEITPPNLIERYKAS